MLGATGRRTALKGTKYLVLSTLPARAAVAVQSPSTARDFHGTPAPAAEFRPTWMPMRVKTPWIEALTRSREAKPQEGAPTSRAKLDLTPRKMSDTYYSAV